MKRILLWVGKRALNATVTAVFFVLAILGTVYASSVIWPTSHPTGEVEGGKFMNYFNSIKAACPAGQYLNGYDANFNKLCAVAPAGAPGATGPQGPAGNGVSGLRGVFLPLAGKSISCDSSVTASIASDGTPHIEYRYNSRIRSTGTVSVSGVGPSCQTWANNGNYRTYQGTITYYVDTTWILAVTQQSTQCTQGENSSEYCAFWPLN